jgi:ribonuclease BN (tRNA processing enzyme)
VTEPTLRLTILGSSGSFAGPGTACSGYLVQSSTTTLWIDCGPGTLANLQHHVELSEVDAMVVTHQHPDHCAELPVVFNAARFYLGIEHLPVHTTAGVRDLTDQQVENGDASHIFDWRIHADGDQFEVGDLIVTVSRTDHPVETLAVRIDCDGASLVYTSDTGPGWNIGALGLEPDVILGEGTVLEHQEDRGIPHLSARQLGQQAADIGARRLILTHVPPTGDPLANQAEAAIAFGQPVELAADGSIFVI